MSPTPETRSWAGTDAAPVLPAGLTWFNVSRPLTLEDLRGRVVLFDFWTAGCINCQHIIPDLKRLEAEFGESIAVVGVHSGKYSTEHEDESVLEAVRRFGIEHPVVNDPDFVVWDAYDAHAWPTVVVVDPRGNRSGKYAGEGVYQVLQPVVASLVDEFRGLGELTPRQLPVSLAAAPSTAVLAYPGDVLADEATGRLYISDTGHNRVIEATLEGRLLRAFGSGEEGFADGAPPEAAFRQPRGLALGPDGNTLYVADTANHAIRAINLATGETTTAAGTGRQLVDLPRGALPARDVAMASPWDLVATAGRLYISMAGVHQLWVFDPAAGTVEVFAGTSREGIGDGDRLTMALLAQPSGITSDGETLFWVDPESSALRSLPVAGVSQVATLVGTGLFDYGDRDGAARDAQLQHPQGVAYDDGALYIADTYNHRLRVFDITAREVGTAAGSARGWSDGAGGAARFDEPGGLSVAAGRVYVADTNNHLVRVFDPRTGVTGTLTLTNVAAVAPTTAGSVETIRLQPQQVTPGVTTLRVRIAAPEGFHLNASAPSTLDVVSANEAIVLPGERRLTWSSDETAVEFPVPVQLAPGATELTATLSAYYCRTGAEALCFVGRYGIVLPITVTPASSLSEPSLEFELPPLAG